MKKIHLIIFSLFLSVFLFSCHSHSLEGYRDEGRAITRNLIKELQKIRTRDQLLASSSKLQKLFDEMADVMIAAQEQRRKQLKQEVPEMMKVDHDLSDSLRFELNRIYNIEGGRAIIEKTQEKALNRLEKQEKDN